MEEVTRCPLCGSAERALFDSRSSRGRSLHNWICRGCGLVFLSPRRSPPELAASHERGFRPPLAEGARPSDDQLWFEQRRAEGQLALLLHAPGRIEDLLEVGCGAGRMMRLAGERLDARTVGVEASAAYREFLSGDGLLAHRSLEELDEKEPGRRFDVVSLSHVLEQMPDPVAYLARLRALLKPGGRIYVEVPNLLAHSSFEPGHLCSFTVDTLRRTVEAAGLEVSIIELHSRPRRHDPRLHYISAVASPSPPGSAPSVSAKPPAPALVRLRRLVGRNGLDHPLWFLRSRAARAVDLLRDLGGF